MIFKKYSFFDCQVKTLGKKFILLRSLQEQTPKTLGFDINFQNRPKLMSN